MPMSPEIASVAIWGYGREGAAALEHMRKLLPDARMTILNDAPLGETAASGAGSAVLTGADIGKALERGDFQLVVKSPGVSPYRPEVEAAKRLGVKFTSVTNLWFEQNPGVKTIAISGTKGKSTTSNLIHHMLVAAGRDTCLIGNGGVPALNCAAPGDYAVLELSSYQIADLAHAPNIAVLTNLHPEHAPWHGSVERYFADKLRLAQLSADTILVANHADARLRAAFSDRPNTVWFNAEKGFRVRGGELFRDDVPAPHQNFRLKGEHNLSNLAAALTVAEVVGLDVANYQSAIGGFGGLPHRLAEFRVGDGILCVDDSISTIPEATIAALKSYPDRDTVLLLGGSDRGQDYRELYEFLPHSRVKLLLLLPINGARIAGEIAAHAMPFEILRIEDLRQAVEEAFKRLEKDDLLLLSPAAPSFGQFVNFEERGRMFEALCRELASRADEASVSL